MTGSRRGLFWVALVVVVVIGFAVVGRGSERSAEPLAPDSPLFELENLLLSPHCADFTEDVFWPAVRLFVTNFMRYTNGEPLLNIVNKS